MEFVALQIQGKYSTIDTHTKKYYNYTIIGKHLHATFYWADFKDAFHKMRILSVQEVLKNEPVDSRRNFLTVNI